ncbi:MAG: L-asparaginase / beta-aspartyl-peptidase [Gammaproteobacteria bacterium]|jgi:beta-aspartyl-peptidase (threonine type)|nr:L-asparaginase / beta-aspartyl-peptidase [Gammaproteobacteria bacterium]
MYGMAIHGGAGTLPRSEMSAEAEVRYRAGLGEAIDAGFALLESGGTSLDAVTRAVMLLEDNPLFNAAKGAVFTLEGRNELDASIMDGHTLRAGAVCGVTRIRNPVELARAVMDKSEYVMLVGTGAEEFASSQGLSFVPESYFHTPERWKQLERIRTGEAGLSPLTISHIGTVGAVAVDAQGRLAAATSTGGMTGKRFQRVGDSPIIGAGTYADDRSCAVSATGHGEIFIRASVAHDICARMRFGGRSIAAAVREVVLQELPALGGEGGVIAIDANASIAIEFNSEGMFRASRKQGEPAKIAIYR